MKQKKDALTLLENNLEEKVSFGMILRAYRTREGMTQHGLAELLEISKSHVSDLENGRKFVSVDRAARFAHKMGTPLNFLLRWPYKILSTIPVWILK